MRVIKQTSTVVLASTDAVIATVLGVVQNSRARRSWRYMVSDESSWYAGS